MSTAKSFDEINEKIRNGKAVVLTAEEVSRMSLELKPSEIAKKVDVVTTGTFAPMCSSGVFINFGHSDPPIRMQNVLLNNVPAYGGIAAVDAYLGATQTAMDRTDYGGAHVIEELLSGKDIKLKATSCGTDCYPRKEIETIINKETVNEIILFNPRNAYQNYPVAVNSSKKTLYTYMGMLFPNYRNATYSTSGELSPLLNDPELRTIGIGTAIFLSGAKGFVAWNGTQFNTKKPRNSLGIPVSNAATLSVIGNLKEMSPDFLKAAYYRKYGVSIFIGIGIPIPVIDEDIAKSVSVRNEQIETIICDYGTSGHPEIGRTNYKALQDGFIELNGKRIRTASMSSMFKARQIAETLKNWIKKDKFQINEPVQQLPFNTSLNSLKIRSE
ncbi:MAG: homocysteine biosynthesis protein [Candidatus Coatesbacteria bacterium]|nr:homocysteine biosynthesis protein [Candidatus Coatesbacteria bacterium]